MRITRIAQFTDIVNDLTVLFNAQSYPLDKLATMLGITSGVTPESDAVTNTTVALISEQEAAIGWDSWNPDGLSVVDSATTHINILHDGLYLIACDIQLDVSPDVYLFWDILHSINGRVASCGIAINSFQHYLHFETTSWMAVGYIIINLQQMGLTTPNLTSAFCMIKRVGL